MVEKFKNWWKTASTAQKIIATIAIAMVIISGIAAQQSCAVAYKSKVKQHGEIQTNVDSTKVVIK